MTAFMTSTAEEVRHTAHLLGWTVNTDRNEDTFVYGSNMLQVEYRRDGSIELAKRYTFFKIDDVQFEEATPPRNKKEKVLAWLAILSS